MAGPQSDPASFPAEEAVVPKTLRGGNTRTRTSLQKQHTIAGSRDVYYNSEAGAAVKNHILAIGEFHGNP